MRLGVRAAIVAGDLVLGDVEVVEGAIAAVGLARGGSGLAVPGYVDLQVNGFGGVDFLSTDVDGYRKASSALLSRGITAYQPTLITAPRQDLLATIAVAREAARIGTGGVRILGVHLEGPFISPLRPGAHLKRGSSRKSLAQEAGRAIRVLLTRDGCRILAATSWAAR